MKEIIFVQQGEHTCVPACLAMVLGIRLDEVVNEFYQDFIDSKITPSQYLASKGVESQVMPTEYQYDMENELYMVLAPSLNIEGELHCLVYDLRQPEVKLFDPNQGRKDKRYYVFGEPKTEKEVMLTGYAFLLKVYVD